MTDSQKTGWTAEKLNALPKWTMIATEDGYFVFDGYRSWHLVGGDEYETSESLASDPGSIRIVSLPIDALLSDEALEIVGELMMCDGDPWNALRAAIAHVTGGQP